MYVLELFLYVSKVVVLLNFTSLEGSSGNVVFPSSCPNIPPHDDLLSLVSPTVRSSASLRMLGEIK